MSYLLDTNVISEHSRPRPNARVLAWLRTLPIEEQFLSVLSVGEIRNGIERLDDARRRERLRLWLERDLQDLFGDRLVDGDRRGRRSMGPPQSRNAPLRPTSTACWPRPRSSTTCGS